MSDLSNVARPYAQAIFEIANDAGDLAGWSDQLELLAAVAGDDSMAAFLKHPAVTNAQQTDVILQVCGDNLTSDGANLVKLLVENDRVAALPDIAENYASRRAEAESVIEADMITATKMAAKQQKQFSAALQKRLGRTVKLTYSVDPDLIGGAVIRAGDWVVDGSVKAQLEQLVGALAA